MLQRRSRKRSRGAAMVEASFVMPVLVMLWFASVYAESVCSAKLDAIATARQQAFGYASSNCGESGDKGPSSFTPISGSTNVAGSSTADMLGDLIGGIAGDIVSMLAGVILDKAFPTSFGQAKLEANGPGKSGFHSSHSSSMVFTCNEVPFNGSLVSFAKDLFTMLVGR